MKNINLFVPKFRKQEIFKHMEECLDKGWTGLGFKTVELEEEWKKYTGFEVYKKISILTFKYKPCIRLFQYIFLNLLTGLSPRGG